MCLPMHLHACARLTLVNSESLAPVVEAYELEVPSSTSNNDQQLQLSSDSSGC